LQGKWEVGEDVTDLLGITKWEPPVSASIGGDIKGNFPSLFPRTDEERIQNLSNEYNYLRGFEYHITEKLDGTSATYFRYNGEFRVCSRNYELKDTEGNLHWTIAHANDNRLFDGLPDGVCLQGEIVGPKVQGNPYKLSKPTLFVFNAFTIDEFNQHWYWSYDKMLALCLSLDINCVPLYANDYKLPASLDEMISRADGGSVISDGVIREGLVLRSYEDRRSFKVISNEFLMGEK
jgi:RNA ligase (TIGR02306 family)